MSEDTTTVDSLSSSTVQKPEVPPNFADDLRKLNELEEKIEDLDKKIKSSNKSLSQFEKELKESKKDYIVFLGLFASIITYLTVEIQILKSVSDFFLLIGLSVFILSGLLIFSLTLNYLAQESNSPKVFFKNPVFWIAFVLFFGSIVCFYLGSTSTKELNLSKSYDQLLQEWKTHLGLGVKSFD